MKPNFAERPPERRGRSGFVWGMLRGLGVASTAALILLLCLKMAANG